jgi:hypothetical protein
MIKNIILTISILLNVAILAFVIWAYIMFNQGFFSYAMTNVGMAQLCTIEFENEQENEVAKKWCDKMTACNEDNEVGKPASSIKGVEEFEENDETKKIIQGISEYCEEYNIQECSPVTSYSVVDLDGKYAVVKVGDINYLLTKKDNEWNVSIGSQENNICDTGSDSPDLAKYCSNGEEEDPAPSIKGNEEEEEIDETEEIVQKISEYCEEYNISECLPVTSYSLVDLDDKYAVMKVGDINYLLTKKDHEWNVSIGSQENNICDTGSGSPDLAEYCSR